MATNLKGKSRFVSILLLHGEKIAIGVVGVMALWFVYKSLGVPRLDDKFQADKLDSEIRQTSTEIKDFTWDRAIADHPDKVKKAIPIAVKTDLTIDPKAYVNLDASGKPGFGVDQSIVAPMIRRSDPLLLNPVDVRATGGSGLFAFIDEEIRKKQALRLIEEAKEAERKALERQKREQQRSQEGGPGGARRGRGPEGEGANEPIDPAHPKRRMIQSSIRPTGNSLQGGERIERAYWACVVAKVPIREQLKLYQDALEKARGYNPERDFPSYVGFYVQRAEVLPGKELEWTPVPLYDGQRQSIVQDKPLTSPPTHAVAKGPTGAFDKLLAAAAQYWAGGIAQDPVDSRYAEYPLTLPLPPLVGREWGAEATHPDIPWGPYTPPLETETPELAAQPTEQPFGANTGGEFGSANPTQGPGVGPGFGAGRPGGEYGGPGSFRGRMGPEGGPGIMGSGMGRRFGGEFGPEGGPGGFRGGGGSGQPAGQHTSLTKGVDYYLFRFFDFSVEPGKKYKYRVKLVVQDPNFNLPPAELDAAVLDRQAKEAQTAKANNAPKPFYRILDKWSEPSPPVGIPMAGNVRLADTKIPSAEKFNDEPVVKLIVEGFDVDGTGTPIQGATKKDFRRGYVANIIGDANYQPDPTMVDIQPDFKFFTGMTLLDVDGGTKIPGARDMTYPARILLMGPAGELYIRNESDDKPYADTYRMIFEESTRSNPYGPDLGPGGRGRPGGRR